MKKKVISIVAILLLVAIAAGALYIYNKQDDIEGDVVFDGAFWDDLLDNKDTTEKDDDSSESDDVSSSEESTTETPATARYVDSDGYGYQTVGGQTFFFKRVKFTSEQESVALSNPGGTLNFYTPSDTVPYSSFELVLRWSYDGVLWQEYPIVHENEITGEITSFMVQLTNSSVTEKALYASYTVVDNCVNPMVVLNDLKANVFTVDGCFDPRLTVHGQSFG